MSWLSLSENTWKWELRSHKTRWTLLSGDPHIIPAMGSLFFTYKYCFALPSLWVMTVRSENSACWQFWSPRLGWEPHHVLSSQACSSSQLSQCSSLLTPFHRLRVPHFHVWIGFGAVQAHKQTGQEIWTWLNKRCCRTNGRQLCVPSCYWSPLAALAAARLGFLPGKLATAQPQPNKDDLPFIFLGK